MDSPRTGRFSISFKTRFSYAALALALLVPAAPAAEPHPDGTSRPPNFIFIYCDNLGYGDIGCFGSKLHRTPHLDRMASEGMRLTSFYSTSGVCTPSRASAMTGCYPRRVSMHESDLGRWVLGAISPSGLHPDEITIAEVLKQRNYATAIIGKWHLGDQPVFLPTRQGFDSWFGIPYSDNATPNEKRPHWPPLPLMRNEKVVEAPAERDTLTKRYTEEAIRFLEKQADLKTRAGGASARAATHPFFLYLPHAMPGSTTAPYSSRRFRGKSANGPYGDSVEELDWSTGEILAALKRLGLEENTLVLWTSDNGAPRRSPPQGSNKPMGGWGYTTAEGGHRIPCIVRWPGRIPAGSICDEIASTMDLLPTFAGLAGVAPPDDRIIDGHDIWPLMSGQPGAKSTYDAFYYYLMGQLQAVRSGKWKLYLPLENRWRNSSKRGSKSVAELYDLSVDSGETANLASSNHDIVNRLAKLAERGREDLGDHGRSGTGQRPRGRVEDPKPQVITVR